MIFSTILSTYIALSQAIPVDRSIIQPFDQYVLRCPITDVLQVQFMQSLELDIWSITSNHIDIRIRSEEESYAIELLSPSCDVWIHNLSDNLNQEEEEVENLFNSNNTNSLIDFHSNTNKKEVKLQFFKQYQTFDSIIEFLTQLTLDHPSLLTLKSIGKSVEGREIPVVILSNIKIKSQKKVIWFNAGQHAREWIAPSTLLYILTSFVSLNSSESDLWLSNFEFHFTPMQNPDGYEYSRLTDRFWRKNRRVNRDGSIGVDLNRNWNEHWGQAGASSNPSSETYMGPNAFSEPETKLLSNYILSLPNRYAGIDFHSYGQLILRNWGWTRQKSKNELIIKQLGDEMAIKIYESSGTLYKSIRGGDMYEAGGCTDDWMTSKAGMIGFTLELRDTGNYGFNLPPSQILPVGREIWGAIQFYLNFLLEHNDIPLNV